MSPIRSKNTIMRQKSTIQQKGIEIWAEINYNVNKKEGTTMTKANSFIAKLAAGFAFFLSAVLFVGANTASSGMIHQPKAPESLRRFSKIK